MLCCVQSMPSIVMLYTPKDREKNIFSDDINFITLFKTSGLQ